MIHVCCKSNTNGRLRCRPHLQKKNPPHTFLSYSLRFWTGEHFVLSIHTAPRPREVWPAHCKLHYWWCFLFSLSFRQHNSIRYIPEILMQLQPKKCNCSISFYVPSSTFYTYCTMYCICLLVCVQTVLMSSSVCVQYTVTEGTGESLQGCKLNTLHCSTAHHDSKQTEKTQRGR